MEKYVYDFDLSKQFNTLLTKIPFVVQVSKYVIPDNLIDELFKNNGLQLEVRYQLYFIRFISQVLQSFNYIHKYKDIQSMDLIHFATLSTHEILDLLSLSPENIEKKIITIDVWGPRFWSFLHYTSFCVTNNTDLTNTFACIMLNFNRVLPCGVCKTNFRQKNPLKLLYQPIIDSGDCITVLYNFHNIVNKDTYKKTFPLSDFEILYNCKRQVQ